MTLAVTADHLPLVIPDEGFFHPSVKTVCSTRRGGVSESGYGALNLGAHVGDDAEHVRHNRSLLSTALDLPFQPLWLTQVHGTVVQKAYRGDDSPEADAIWTDQADMPIAIMTADCLPVVLAHVQGQAVGAAHAGWRGLLGGVLESLLEQLPGQPSDYVAWLGPAIGPQSFEVGAEVRAAFVMDDPQSAEAFTAQSSLSSTDEKWMADLYQLARWRLEKAGLSQVSGGEYCTYQQGTDFFSHRREGPHTGRLATVAWLKSV